MNKIKTDSYITEVAVMKVTSPFCPATFTPGHYSLLDFDEFIQTPCSNFELWEKGLHMFCFDILSTSQKRSTELRQIAIRSCCIHFHENNKVKEKYFGNLINLNIFLHQLRNVETVLFYNRS